MSAVCRQCHEMAERIAELEAENAVFRSAIDANVEACNGPCSIPATADVSSVRITIRSESERWLRDFLSRGARPRGDVLQAAKVDGFAERTIERAREAIGVVRMIGYDSERRLPFSSWVLPRCVLSATTPDQSDTELVEHPDEPPSADRMALDDYPRFFEGPPIDITGGVDPGDYVASLHDDEEG